jgi:excisionase family DNA binding protein
MYEGEPLFNEEKGFFSVDKASELIGVVKQKLYYAIRTGMLKATRKGAAYVIHVDDLFTYQAEYLKNDCTAKRA